MRGRTNAGDGVSLNANTVNKYVAAGQITAGDFVEYYSEPKYIVNTIGPRFNIGPYTVGGQGTAVAILKNDELVSVYSDYTISEICKYNDFIIFRSDSNIGVLKIQNDQLVLVDIITDITGTCISAGNGKVVVLNLKKENSYYVISKGYVIDISNTGELSNAKSTTFSQVNVGPYSQVNSIGLTYVDSDEAFYTYTKINDINSNPYNYKVEVDAENNLLLTSTFNGGISSFNILAQFGSRLIIQILYTIYSYDVKSGNMVGIYTLDNYYTPGIIDNNLFVAYRANSSGVMVINVQLYYYNDQLNNITLLDEYSMGNDSFNPSLTAFNYNTKYVYLPYGASGTRLLTVIDDNKIQDIPDPDRVVPYTAGGNPIGVAKTNGNIGDTIPIYIPTPTI